MTLNTAIHPFYLFANASLVQKIYLKTYFDYCIYYISPECDFDREYNNPFVLHDIPAHDDASPYQVW